MISIAIILGMALASAKPARIIEPPETGGPIAPLHIPGHPEIKVPVISPWMFDGGMPEKRVRDWIKIRSIGASNHPWGILYFAPEPLRVTGLPEYSYALPRPLYRALAALTMAQPCRRRMPTQAEMRAAGRKRVMLDWGVFQIDQSVEGKRRSRCILWQRENCAYFDHIADMPIRWTRENFDGVLNMALTLECSSEQAAKWERIGKPFELDPS